MKRLLGIAFVVGSLIVVACGDDDATGGSSSSSGTGSSTSGNIGGGSSTSGGATSSSSGGLSLSGYATAICEKVQKCQPAAFSQSWATTAECVTDVEASNKNGVSALPGSKITQDQIDACGAEISGSTCAFGLNDLAKCVLRGTLAAGAGCYDGRQCQSGRCKRANLSDDCGACASFETTGGSCLEDGDCDFGLTCLDGKCAKLGAKGETCTVDGKRCDAGLVCANGKCADAADKGFACTATGNECRRGLVCTSGTCQDVTVKVAALGEPCDAQTTCRKSSCRGGKCIPYATTGSACGGDGSALADCDGDDFCRDGKCEANTYPDCK